MMRNEWIWICLKNVEPPLARPKGMITVQSCFPQLSLPFNGFEDLPCRLGTSWSKVMAAGTRFGPSESWIHSHSSWKCLATKPMTMKKQCKTSLFCADEDLPNLTIHDTKSYKINILAGPHVDFPWLSTTFLHPRLHQLWTFHDATRDRHRVPGIPCRLSWAELIPWSLRNLSMGPVVEASCGLVAPFKWCDYVSLNAHLISKNRNFL